MKNYNTTQLNPDTCFEKHVFHRDHVGHWLRWSFALNKLKIGMNVLDFGCGSGNLAEVMYRNRYKGINLFVRSSRTRGEAKSASVLRQHQEVDE